MSRSVLMDERGGLIRTDGLGRLRFTADQRKALLDGFEGSGLSASRFAAQHGVKYTTFANWLQQRRKSRPGGLSLPAPSGPTSFVLAEVSRDVPSVASISPPLEVTLPGGAKLLVSDTAQAHLAAALIREFTTGQPC